MDTIDDVELFTVSLSSVAPAEGRVVNLDYPTSVEYEELIDINAATQNIGEQSGRFKMEIYRDGVLLKASSMFTLAGGETSADKIYPFRAPTSGTGIDIEIKCIRLM
jgi:hypothetical protein